MRLISVSPLAASPASTSDTEARRSVAMTGAPLSRSTPAHQRRGAVDVDPRAHAGQFRHVHEAVLEDPLGDHRRPVGHAHQRHELGLQVGRETGERPCHGVAALEPARGDPGHDAALDRRQHHARASSTSLAAPRWSSRAFLSTMLPPVTPAAMA